MITPYNNYICQIVYERLRCAQYFVSAYEMYISLPVDVSNLMTSSLQTLSGSTHYPVVV